MLETHLHSVDIRHVDRRRRGANSETTDRVEVVAGELGPY